MAYVLRLIARIWIYGLIQVRTRIYEQLELAQIIEAPARAKY